MRIDLDMQEREVLKNYAQSMITVIKHDIKHKGAMPGIGLNAINFWQRIVQKMDPAAKTPPIQ